MPDARRVLTSAVPPLDPVERAEVLLRSADALAERADDTAARSDRHVAGT